MDHNDLNSLTGIRTTAENFAHWIWDALVSGGVPDHLLIASDCGNRKKAL